MYKFILLLSCFLLFLPKSQATIIYDAEASSVFELVSAGGLLISADITPDATSTATAGTGIATIDADSQSDPTLFPGMPLIQDSAVSGSASSSFGTSMAESLNSYFIDIDNPTMDTLTAHFIFSYSWSLSLIQAPAADAPFEMAFASAFFHLDGFAPSGSETLAIDEGLGAGIVSMTDWLVHPMIEFSFADLTVPGALSGSASVDVYVTAPGMSSNRFSVITDAFGAAVHIPEPKTLLLVTVGFLMLNIRRRSSA